MKTTKIIHIGQERLLLKPSVFLEDKENIFLENPINTPIESPSHLIEIPSDGVCPVIKNGTFKEGDYLLFLPSSLCVNCRQTVKYLTRLQAVCKSWHEYCKHKHKNMNMLMPECVFTM